MPAWLVLTRKRSDGTVDRTCSPWPEQGLSEEEIARLKREGYTIEHPPRQPEVTKEGTEVNQ